MIYNLLRQHVYLIPLFGAATFGCVGGIWFTGYIAYAKGDVRWKNKSSDIPTVEKEQYRQKLWLWRRDDCLNEDVQKLRAELDAYEA